VTKRPIIGKVLLDPYGPLSPCLMNNLSKWRAGFYLVGRRCHRAFPGSDVPSLLGGDRAHSRRPGELC
jgi:hypothetical protein